MKEHPIIFSPEMVLAILEGRKSQTRRIIRDDWWICLDPDEPEDRKQALGMCPYGVPGDHLWVREKARLRSVGPGTEYSLHYAGGDTIYDYRGDANHRPYKFDKWTPSIHMPRWASRLTLEVLNVRVKRLQNITLNDIEAEGTPPIPDQMVYRNDGYQRYKDFEFLWNSIHGPNAWDINPWVWAITFKEINT